MKEFASRLTWVDYVALIVVLRGIYVGFRSGLFPELIRIASYLATFVVTFRFYEPLAQYLTLNTFLNSSVATAVAFVAILLGTFLATKLAAMLLLKLLKVGEGGVLIRLLGAGIGACRWVILLSFLFMVIDHSPLAQLKKDIHTRSLTGQKISAIGPALFDFLANVSPQLSVPKNTVS